MRHARASNCLTNSTYTNISAPRAATGFTPCPSESNRLRKLRTDPLVRFIQCLRSHTPDSCRCFQESLPLGLLAVDLISCSKSVEPLPLPSGSELRLARAQRLVADQRAHEALSVLMNIGEGDPLFGEAEALRTAIQKQLLANVQSPDPAPAAEVALSR